MPRRNAAVHLAATPREYQGKVYKTYLRRRSYREGGRVRHRTLGDLSGLPEAVIELIARYLRGERVGTGLRRILRASSPRACRRRLRHGALPRVGPPDRLVPRPPV